MMRLNIAPAPWPGAPVVVLSAGLGGGGGYWLAQRAALEEQYQLVSYDHNGTGENAGPLPANILPLVARHVYNQENTLTAALTCDRTLGLTTFMNDPQVTLNWNQGKELFDTMLHNTRAYLPKEWNA